MKLPMCMLTCQFFYMRASIPYLFWFLLSFFTLLLIMLFELTPNISLRQNVNFFHLIFSVNINMILFWQQPAFFESQDLLLESMGPIFISLWHQTKSYLLLLFLSSFKVHLQNGKLYPLNRFYFATIKRDTFSWMR